MDFSLSEKIPVGISQCLLGDNVRYDGGHKRSALCTEVLSHYFEFVAACPEMGIGMGAPREAIHLVGSLHDDAVRAVGIHTATLDVTDALKDYGRHKADELAFLCGYIFKERSPSCGLENIPLHDENGKPLGKSGRGLYAREFTQRHFLLPVIEEKRLRDTRIRENFVIRVQTWGRWLHLIGEGLTLANLQEFHGFHQVMLASQGDRRALDHLLAEAEGQPLTSVADDYIRKLMTGLRLP